MYQCRAVRYKRLLRARAQAEILTFAHSTAQHRGITHCTLDSEGALSALCGYTVLTITACCTYLLYFTMFMSSFANRPSRIDSNNPNILVISSFIHILHMSVGTARTPCCQELCNSSWAQRVISTYCHSSGSVSTRGT